MWLHQEDFFGSMLTSKYTMFICDESRIWLRGPGHIPLADPAIATVVRPGKWTGLSSLSSLSAVPADHFGLGKQKENTHCSSP